MVWQPAWGPINTLTKYPFSALVLVLCLLTVFGGYTFWLPRRIYNPLGDGLVTVQAHLQSYDCDPRSTGGCFNDQTMIGGHGLGIDIIDGPQPPIVRLDRATVVGKSQGQTETFQGIPYARPP